MKKGKQNAITLIALIITIIVMLILVGVTVSVALNGGLFTTAKKAANKTHIEVDKELLLSAAMGALGENGEVDFTVLDANLPNGFEGSNGTYTSKTGNTYTVDVYGNVEYVSETGEVEETEKIISADDTEASYWKTDGQGTILYYEPEEGIEAPETLVVPCQIGDEKITKIGDYALMAFRAQRNEDGSVVFDEEYGDPIILDTEEDENGIPILTGPTAKVKNIVISKGIQEIGKGEFYANFYLQKISMPSTVTEIGTASFSACYSLTSVTIPNNVTEIEEALFNSCTSLNTIVLPERLTVIGKTAFSSCRSLTNITLPEGLITIGEAAFEECTSLKDITIPSTVDNMGAYPFKSWTNEQTIYIKGKTEEPVDIDNDDYSGIGWSTGNWLERCSANIVWDT